MWTQDDFPGADHVPWQLLIRARFVHEIDAVIASRVVTRLAPALGREKAVRLAAAGTVRRGKEEATDAHIVGALRGEHYDYTKGNLSRAILLLAVPMVLEMSFESLFALVDIWWVNRIDDGWFGATPTGGAAAARRRPAAPATTTIDCRGRRRAPRLPDDLAHALEQRRTVVRNAVLDRPLDAAGVKNRKQGRSRYGAKKEKS